MQYAVVSGKGEIVVSVGEVRGDVITWQMWSERPSFWVVRCEMCDEYWCFMRDVGVRCVSGCSMVECVCRERVARYGLEKWLRGGGVWIVWSMNVLCVGCRARGARVVAALGGRHSMSEIA